MATNRLAKRQGHAVLLAEQSIPFALGIAEYACGQQTGRIAREVHALVSPD
jgi:ABC-type branched-subunit amino acid transport system ATPase component